MLELVFGIALIVLCVKGVKYLNAKTDNERKRYHNKNW